MDQLSGAMPYCDWQRFVRLHRDAQVAAMSATPEDYATPFATVDPLVAVCALPCAKLVVVTGSRRETVTWACGQSLSAVLSAPASKSHLLLPVFTSYRVVSGNSI